MCVCVYEYVLVCVSLCVSVCVVRVWMYISPSLSMSGYAHVVCVCVCACVCFLLDTRLFERVIRMSKGIDFGMTDQGFYPEAIILNLQQVASPSGPKLLHLRMKITVAPISHGCGERACAKCFARGLLQKSAQEKP